MTAPVLVTGACGFIGSHLAEELVRQGRQVRALTQYNSFGWRGWLEHADCALRDAMEIVAGDVRDPFAVRQAMQGCGSVFHLAALIAIPYSYAAPQSYVATNVSGTLNVLQAALELGLERVVHTSTSEVYGSARFTPITEEHPLQAQSPYAATKVAADQLALSYRRSFGLPVTVLRPFNTFGPRQSTRAVIPTIVTQLASGQRDIRLGALSPQRDFNFVMDTVQGFIDAEASESALGEVLNLASGHAVSIGELFELIAGIMGLEARVVCDEQRIRPPESEVDCLLGDSTRLQELTGWRPRRSGAQGLRLGLEETVHWFSDPAHLAMYRPNEYMI